MWGRVAQKPIYAFTSYVGHTSCAYSLGRKNAYVREVHEN